MRPRDFWRVLLAPYYAGFCYFGGSDSESSTENISEQTDARATGGDSSQNISSSNSNISVNVAPVDFGAVTKGIDAARESTMIGALVSKAAIDSGERTSIASSTASAYASAEASKATAATAAKFADNTKSIFSEGIQANTKALNSSLEFANASSNSALSFARSVNAEAQDFSEASMNKSLGLATAAMDTAASASKSALSTTVNGLQEAYSTAKAGDQKIVSMVALSVLGLGLVMALRGGK